MIDVSRARIGPEPTGKSALSRVPASVFYGRLNRLKRLNSVGLTEQRAFDRLSQALHGYVMRGAIIGSKGVFRARVGPPDRLFQNTSELWYPKPELVKRRGRFNGAGESRFYCSSEIHTAFEEVRPKVGDRVTLLIAGARSPSTKFELAHVGIQHAVVGSEVVGTMGGGLRRDKEFLAQLKAWGITKRWLALDDYLTDLATAVYEPAVQDERYIMSVSAGRYLLRPPAYQGILYPSVASEFSGFNLCLYPESADRLFYPSEAWAADILSRRPTGELEIRFAHRSTSISSSGEIDWSGRLVGVEPEEVQKAIGRAVRLTRADHRVEC